MRRLRTASYIGVCMILCLFCLAGAIALGTVAPYLLVACLAIVGAAIYAALTDEEMFG